MKYKIGDILVFPNGLHHYEVKQTCSVKGYLLRITYCEKNPLDMDGYEDWSKQKWVEEHPTCYLLTPLEKAML